MMNTKAENLIKMYQSLKGARANFESYWQSLHDYFYIEAEDINRSYHPGTELSVTALFDSTTLEAADVLAHGFMSYLTPATSKWFSLKSKNTKLRTNRNVEAYLEDVADVVNGMINDSNYYSQAFANYKGSGVYGTSVMLAEEDDKEDVLFYHVPIKNVCLVEDAKGRVVEYFIEFEYTPAQAANRFGIENLSTKMREDALSPNSESKKCLFVLFIGERHYRDIRKTDRKNMPYEATWIDVAGKMIVDEGGYNEMPIMCHRFDKRPFIPWGFSPAMKALPFARILNAIAKTNLTSMMKANDPALALPDGAFIKPFNQNPRAINFYNPKAMLPGGIIEIGGKGNPQAGLAAIEMYQNKVKSLMFNDVFLAFDGLTKQMNNPEVLERINEKMTILGSATGRYINEMISPTIERLIGIAARKGKLPPAPDEIIEDPRYDIDCVSQLAQAQRRSEFNALVTGLNMVAQMAQVAPESLDKIDQDKVIDEVWSITGAPNRVMREESTIAAMREARAQQALAQQQMAMNEQGANIVEKGSKVDLNMAKTKEASK